MTIAGADPKAKVRIATVLEIPLDVAAHSESVRRNSGGAEVTFCGVVRDHDHGRTVIELEYTSYPNAVDVIAEVAAEIASEPDVLAVAVSHRIGMLRIGDVALVASVSAAHRGQAFAACARLVDEVKARLPIWKRQVFSDGTDEWVNCP
ncbi:molybdenum cofactor biosynthesis protein MoaE [Jatrophihabitans telluris]|uniref:Molybdenum cofactor biosynthesis protein MoaE n=1 Tax=Jatrophihabitans telluris TaxID=2038343 RepID=A0ABY4QZZ7_9ACTN|nr:molybdenum cofactor biosynthesis protein MoaE [Jatrophihabitans telluris]UQX89231.1 molybdenum cofactor biosynthesis protein MoaE [Jatrophihabitans telluris]